MKGTGKNKDEFFNPKDMALCIDLKKYHICIKKHKEVWR